MLCNTSWWWHGSKTHGCAETYRSCLPHAAHFYLLTMWADPWPGGQPGRKWTCILPPLNKKWPVEATTFLLVNLGPSCKLNLLWKLTCFRVFGEMPTTHTHTIPSSFQRFPFLISPSLDSLKDQQIQERSKEFNFWKMEKLENLNFPLFFFSLSNNYNRFRGEKKNLLPVSKLLEEAMSHYLSCQIKKTNISVTQNQSLPSKYE